MMAYPRVILHGDGAVVIDAVAVRQVDPDRAGQRVWVFLAQFRRPFGTAAEYVAVPSARGQRGRAGRRRGRQIPAVAPGGVDRVAEVALDTGIAVDLEILKIGGAVTGYATGKCEPSIPFRGLCFKNITVRFLVSRA